MKIQYYSPMIEVEELTKPDILCASTEINTEVNAANVDNANQLYSTLADFSNFM